jgi:serine protease inhibitor ecotin
MLLILATWEVEIGEGQSRIKVIKILSHRTRQVWCNASSVGGKGRRITVEGQQR